MSYKKILMEYQQILLYSLKKNPENLNPMTYVYQLKVLNE